MKLLLEYGTIIQTVNQTRVRDFDGDIEVVLYGRNNEETVKISDKQYKYFLHKGDIVIPAVNHSNAIISVIKEDDKYIADNRYIVFRPNDNKYSSYFKIIIEKALEKQRYVNNITIGNRTDLREIEVDKDKLDKFCKISEIIINQDELLDKQYELDKNRINYFKNRINKGEL